MAATTTYTCDACGEPISENTPWTRVSMLTSFSGSATNPTFADYDLHRHCGDIAEHFIRFGIRAGRR